MSRSEESDVAPADAQRKIAELEIRLKEAELSLKERELKDRPGPFATAILSPSFLAGVIAVSATIGTSLLTYINAVQQRNTDTARLTKGLRMDQVRREDILLREIFDKGSIDRVGGLCEA